MSLNEFFDYCEEARTTLASTVELGAESGSIPATPLDILISLSDDERERRSSPFVSPEGFLSKRTLNRLLPFSAQMKMLRRKAQVEPVSELLSSIIDTMQLRNHFDSISKTTDEFADRWSNVMELRNAAERYTKEGGSLSKKEDAKEGDEKSQVIPDVDDVSPLGNFLDDVSLLTEISDGDSDTDGDDSEDGPKRLHVNLMTIHASKGMEFDAVFLVGNEEGTYVSILTRMPDRTYFIPSPVTSSVVRAHLIKVLRRRFVFFTQELSRPSDLSRRARDPSNSKRNGGSATLP